MQMTTFEFEFDGDEDDIEDYYLVAEEGTLDSSGHGVFIDSCYNAYHSYYNQACRYYNSWEAERVRGNAEQRNGKNCVIIEVTQDEL